MYGGLLSDYWFEETNDRLLTRKFPENLSLHILCFLIKITFCGEMDFIFSKVVAALILDVIYFHRFCF